MRESLRRCPHRVIREALSHLLSKHHEITGESAADVVIRYLGTPLPPYPPPASAPTLALILGSDDDAVELLALGYRAVLGSGGSVEELEQALGALLEGGYWATTQVIAKVIDGPLPSSRASLTERQGQVYELVIRGHSNYAIAQLLGISVHTAKGHLHRILHKMHTGRRINLILQTSLPNLTKRRER